MGAGFEELGSFYEVAESSPIEEKEREYCFSQSTVCVYNATTKENMYLPLEEYVGCVMLAEAPSWYHKEALKAIAVAVRTYTLYKALNPSHEGGASVCTSSTHCQAFYSLEEASKLWGDKSANEAYELVKKAVLETEGEILLYDSEPILAMYHASSYLCTKGFGDVEYLQSVSVPFENELTSRKFEKSYSHNECLELLGVKGERLQLYDVWQGDLCVGMRVVCDGVESMITPDRVRALFSLSSPNFRIEKSREGFLFKSFGFGHGVGLSQEGANVMAQSGKDYDVILSHYYTNTNLAKLKISE
jgi:stage II sporulation protein D